MRKVPLGRKQRQSSKAAKRSPTALAAETDIKNIPTVFIDGLINEDWPKHDPKVKEDELKAFDEAKKLERKRKLDELKNNIG
jgi:hypothetical protein